MTTIDLHTHTRKMHIGAAEEEARDAERAKWVGRPLDRRCRWSVHITASDWRQWSLWYASRPPVAARRALCHCSSTWTARARNGSLATRCQRIGGLQFNIFLRFSGCWSTSSRWCADFCSGIFVFFPHSAARAAEGGLVDKRVQVGVPGHGWVGLTLNT